MTNISKIALFDQTGDTVSQAVTAISARKSLGRAEANVAESLLVSVVGADPVFVKMLTANSGDATTADRIFLGNTQSVVPLPAGITHVAVISTGTASTAYFAAGNGA